MLLRAAFLAAAVCGPVVAPAVAQPAAPSARTPAAPTVPGAPAPAGVGPAKAEPASGVPGPAPTAKSGDPADAICEALGVAAAENELPLAFFTRLIWQESRFKPGAVSRAGAQGVAQFMPRTAAWRGLADPFDPLQALPQSAAYLRDLRREFGNLGLAAAAYNGGSGRVRNWLEKRGELPRETRAYVAIITGHTVEDWAAADRSLDELAFPRGIPCSEVAALLAAARAGGSGGKGGRAAAPARKPVPLWGVQLAANWNEGKALAAFVRMRDQYEAILAGREPLVLRNRAGRGATMHRVRIAAETRSAAEQLCSRLRAAGGACVVLRN